MGETMTSGHIHRAALKRLFEVLGNDVEELEELRGDYVEDAPALARRISEAASKGDWTALRIAAHTLKSNAHDFGATRLSELCAFLEKACYHGGPADADALAEGIAQEEEAARKALLDVSFEDIARPSPDA
ncbi:Hpt domain-containing protein [Roseovarius autotrophicus]|uniref:Hpt domain-containing protein n=1 Tax=Roseovarius autotrophicus TaxID=2824121 RepID=UPI001B39621E|nr:Hpt domain-containing protein [Roseovarius autotrophicus]